MVRPKAKRAREDAALRRQAASEVAKAQRGRTKVDRGDILRSATPASRRKVREDAKLKDLTPVRDARLSPELARLVRQETSLRRPNAKADDRSLLERALDAGGDVVDLLENAAGVLYPKGTKGGKGKPNTASISAGLGTPVQQSSLLVRVPVNVGRALAEDPVGTSKGTAKGLRDALLGVPAGLIGAVSDPVGTLKQTGEDYARRYGPLLEGGGDREFIERLKKEGAAGEMLDATIVASGPGSVAGRAGAGAARKGTLGAKAQRTVTEPRRKQRTSGGSSEQQEAAPTLGKAIREKRRDEAAFRGQQRAAARADSQRKGRASKGPVRVEVREALEAGEVVPSRPTGVRVRRTESGRRALELSRQPSDRKLTKAQRRSYATAKGRALQAQRREQRAEVGAAKRNLASLSAHEQAAFKDALQLGATSPKAARAIVARRLALIERERAKGDVDVVDTDEVPVLRALLAAPEAHFTQKLARVVGEERARGRRVAVGDPGVALQQALLRVTKPQAEALGITRSGTPIKAAQQTARQAARTAKAKRARAGRDVESAQRKAAREEGRTKLLVQQGAGRDVAKAKLLDRQAVALDDQAARLRKLSRKNTMGKRATDPLADVGVLTDAQRRYRHKARRTGVRQQGVQVGSQSYRTGQRQARRAQELKQRAEGLRAEAEALRGRKPGEHTEPVRALKRLERARADVLVAERGRDAARARVTEAKATQRDLSARRNRGQELVDAEPVEAFVVRTSDAAEAAGMQAPGYFPSRKREQARYSPFAAGGAKAVQPDRRYTGKLFREGREDASQATYLQGLAQGIKRKYNWNLVADTFDAHTVAWGRDKTIGQLEDELVRRGVDPDSVAFWNAGRYRRARSEWEKTDGSFDERDGGEEPVAAGVGEAVRQSSIDGRGLATQPDAFRATRGWSIVPRALHDEVHADTKPSGPFARSLDVVKGKQSRIMLGLSPAWLQFQVASNGLLAGLAGTGPLDLLKANLTWWRSLTDDEKKAIEPYVGVGPFSDSYDQTRLGASANSAIVNAYRALKAHDFWHKPRAAGKSVRDLNPLDVLFRIDNAQNNTFRRAVLYSQIKRDAYKRMGGRVRAIQRDQDGLARILTLGPEDAMRAVLHDPAALERHARHVNGFLGDYMTYTAKERRWLQRNVIFYGFLRHSLRLVFYTLPARHPLIASLVGQLGRMQTAEVRRLLGGDELPWALGKFYTSKDGKLQSVDVSRANPALNTITSLRGPSSLVGLMPPLFTSLANQAYSKSSFKQRPYRVQGETQGRKDTAYSAEDRTRIFVEEMLTLAAPYRAVKKATSTGPEGDDSSLLLGRRPTKYKRPDIVASIKREQERRPGSIGERLLLEMAPLVPRDDNARELAASIRQRNGQSRAGAAAAERPLTRQEQVLARRARRLASSRSGSAQQDVLARRAARIAAGR
ncbi:MAG TPA: hypothetical protein VMY78_16630 [Solirubrobacteraceae bacterium]|nr:hypothetical protein [Solirubrobacteraceae bacterium]